MSFSQRNLISLFIFGMLFTGASNSLWSKWQDMQCVAYCDDPSKKQVFEQPLWQTLTMFLGETLCLMVFVFLSSRFNVFRRSIDPDAHLHTHKHEAAPLDVANWTQALLFFLPSTCDIAGTTLMNIGLLFIPVSIYQMLRGALVLWVAAFSVLFLGRKLEAFHWTSLAVVMLGVGVVGLSSVKSHSSGIIEEESRASPLLGIAFVLGAQIFTATQFVLEEKIMSSHNVDPLAAVGYEGVFGSLTVVAALPILYYLIGNTPAGKGGYFDAPVGFHQIFDNPPILASSFAIMISIAFFNFCGLAVTKNVSATARSTIDTCRTLGIWVVSLALGWESFAWLQVLGFALLVYGTFVFNGIAFFPAFTGIHGIPVIPAIISVSEDEDEDEDDDASTLRPNESAASGRGFASSRRGEASPLLENGQGR